MDNIANKFGLRHKKSGKILCVHTRSNADGDFCCETQHYLETDGDSFWLVDIKEHAEYVRNFATDWYNATYETPGHNFSSEDLEVVKINVTIKVEPVKVKIPTVMQFYAIKYKKKDPAHFKYIVQEYNKYEYRKKDFNYNWFELKEYLEGNVRKNSVKKCDCENPGYFNSGVPGIIAHLENGKLLSGSKVEKCDKCLRYLTDKEAEKELHKKLIKE